MNSNLRNLLKAPVCDASTFKIGQADFNAVLLLYYQEQQTEPSEYAYGGQFGQAYTNENCCLKCTQTPGCVSWSIYDDQMAIQRCFLLAGPQSNFEEAYGYNGGNILPSLNAYAPKPAA